MVDLDTVCNHPFGLTREGVDLAIHQLHLTKRAALLSYSTADGVNVTLVKVAGANKTVTAISEHERNRFDLHRSVASKTKQIELLDTQIQAADLQMRQFVRDKKMNQAKIQLRTKKSLEAQLGECF